MIEKGYVAGAIEVSSGIMWEIYPVTKENEYEGLLVELQYGWTAGMEDSSNIAEDAPKGYDTLTITLEQAQRLVERLSKVLEDNKHRIGKKTAKQLEFYQRILVSQAIRQAVCPFLLKE